MPAMLIPPARSALPAGRFPDRTPDGGSSRPAWRGMLEARWQQRLSALTELSLAYHDATERSGGYRPDGRGGPREIRLLMREAAVARCALRDTEEALARLTDGSYGQCEQCSVSIPAAELLAEPEIRYCAKCALGSPSVLTREAA
jgi:DnaK suppressor protein